MKKKQKKKKQLGKKQHFSTSAIILVGNSLKTERLAKQIFLLP